MALGLAHTKKPAFAGPTLPADSPPAIGLWLWPSGEVKRPIAFAEDACVFHGFLPPSPWECCHVIQRISATQSTGMLPSSLRHACHPRSVATLDRMMSLCALLLSMAVASAVHFFAVLPPGQPRRSSPMKRTQRPSGKAASCWSLGATRRWACLIYTAGALANVACRLRMESPLKAIL